MNVNFTIFILLLLLLYAYPYVCKNNLFSVIFVLFFVNKTYLLLAGDVFFELCIRPVDEFDVFKIELSIYFFMH